MTIPQDNYFQLAKLRLDWAAVGTSQLEEQIDSFLATNPCEVIPTVTRTGSNAHISYILHVHRRPPATIRFAAGDVVNNLLATLNNLVWGVGQVQCIKANQRPDLKFYLSESTFRKRYLSEISRLPDPIREWITSLQPYQTRKHMPMLYRLHRLWGEDKHCAPMVVSTTGEPGMLAYTGPRTPLRRMVFHRVSGHMSQQEIATAIIPWERRSEFQPEFNPLVAFDVDGIIGRNIANSPENVVDYLQHLQQYILTKVVPLFEPYV